MRAYVDGYDVSGYSRSVDTCGITMGEVDLTTFTDGVHGFLPGTGEIMCGKLNTVLDPLATVTPHSILSGGLGLRTVTYAFGDRAAPAQGVPVFTGQFEQVSYDAADDGGAIVATIDFKPTARGLTRQYFNPFGVLLHPMGAETGANTATGVDDTAIAASTLRGGYLVYHVNAFATAGSFVVKVQDAATNVDGSFADLAGATTGSLSTGTIPCHGAIAIGNGATVRQFLRWQIVLTTTTSLTFALSFVRARGG
jgi:hypothetical protein